MLNDPANEGTVFQPNRPEGSSPTQEASYASNCNSLRQALALIALIFSTFGILSGCMQGRTEVNAPSNCAIANGWSSDSRMPSGASPTAAIDAFLTKHSEPYLTSSIVAHINELPRSGWRISNGFKIDGSTVYHSDADYIYVTKLQSGRSQVTGYDICKY